MNQSINGINEIQNNYSTEQSLELKTSKKSKSKGKTKDMAGFKMQQRFQAFEGVELKQVFKVLSANNLSTEFATLNVPLGFYEMVVNNNNVDIVADTSENPTWAIVLKECTVKRYSETNEPDSFVAIKKASKEVKKTLKEIDNIFKASFSKTVSTAISTGSTVIVQVFPHPKKAGSKLSKVVTVVG
jgi:hypothetical protein